MKTSKISKLFLITIFMGLCVNMSVYAALGCADEAKGLGIEEDGIARDKDNNAHQVEQPVTAQSRAQHKQGRDSVHPARALSISEEEFRSLPLLMQSAACNDMDRVLTLVNNGADVNQAVRVGSGWYTALKCAVASGHVDAARLLIDADACVAPSELNDMPLIVIAANRGSVPMTQLLIEKKADVTVEDMDNRDALSHAAYNGHIEVVKQLCAVGAAEDEDQIQECNALWWICLAKPANVDDAAWCKARALLVRLLVTSGMKHNHIPRERISGPMRQVLEDALAKQPVIKRSVDKYGRIKLLQENGGVCNQKEEKGDAICDDDLVVRHLVNIQVQQERLKKMGVNINKYTQEFRRELRDHRITGLCIGAPFLALAFLQETGLLQSMGFAR